MRAIARALGVGLFVAAGGCSLVVGDGSYSVADGGAAGLPSGPCLELQACCEELAAASQPGCQSLATTGADSVCQGAVADFQSQGQCGGGGPTSGTGSGFDGGTDETADAGIDSGVEVETDAAVGTDATLSTDATSGVDAFGGTDGDSSTDAGATCAALLACCSALSSAEMTDCENAAENGNPMECEMALNLLMGMCK